MKNKLKFRIIYLFFLILLTYFCFIILEIYLANIPKKNSNENTNYDSRSIQQLYSDNINQGVNISPSIHHHIAWQNSMMIFYTLAEYQILKQFFAMNQVNMPILIVINMDLIIKIKFMTQIKLIVS